MSSDDLKERRDHFVVMLGGCADAAAIGSMLVRVELDDGTVVEGVPDGQSSPSDGEEEFDHSGVDRVLLLDEQPVDVARVVSYSVLQPT